MCGLRVLITQVGSDHLLSGFIVFYYITVIPATTGLREEGGVKETVESEGREGTELQREQLAAIYNTVSLRKQIRVFICNK